ncbi:hypothetical protein L211DRAFT_833947 [Terfezia boudieri ATCC MYA-4762]|uniref:Uncharacterized protein n=1 Tax=Terfezia boudieri ATCC MYA-4762 TaxID=1051890 RepID=A0A3N4LYG1_9PEZI|nr:hypothetical protein L211DRAFT_833947 [Terfezia boudieri ATCC MYA-4762]
MINKPVGTCQCSMLSLKALFVVYLTSNTVQYSYMSSYLFAGNLTLRRLFDRIDFYKPVMHWLLECQYYSIQQLEFM